MKIIKVLSNTIASVGSTIETTAKFVENTVTKLNTITDTAGNIVEMSLIQSSIEVELEAKQNIKETAEKHELTKTDVKALVDRLSNNCVPKAVEAES